MSHTIIVVSTTEELQTAIMAADNDTLIKIKAGRYDSVNIDTKDGLILQAFDSNNKPSVERINIFNSLNIDIKSLVLGAENFDIQTNAAMGINASYSDYLSFTDLEIKNARDAIGIRHANHVVIENNNIHDIERDGMSLFNVHDLLVKDNMLRAFHPNYENFLYEDWYFDSEGVAYLPDKVTPADHADFIQLTHGCSATITGNILDATGGAWTQSIFIVGDRSHNHDSITVTNNIIKNGHQIGIRVMNQDAITEANNTITQIETAGIRGTQAEHQPRVRIDEYPDVYKTWVVADGKRVLLDSAISKIIIPPNSEENVVTIPLEGEEGATHVNYFLLQVPTALSFDVSIQYETRDGTAIAGQDYIATSGSATLFAGETYIAIAVDIIGDNIAEEDEEFSLVATTASGQEIVATHTIMDDDIQLNRLITQARLSGINETEVLTEIF